MNIGRLFARTAKRYPTSIALVDRSTNTRYTYREWYDRASTVAAALDREGIGTHSHVGTVMGNRAELATIYCATQLLGATFVPYDFRMSATELTHVLNNSSPDVLIFSESARDAILDGRSAFECDPELVGVDVGESFATEYSSYVTGGSACEPKSVNADRTSLILHTAGTTGLPKGVPLTHTNTYAAATAHAIQASWSQQEVVLGAMALSHTMGIHALIATLLLGGTWVSQRHFSAEETIDAIESEGVTCLYLFPTIFHDITEAEATASADLSSVRNVTFAGANMAPKDTRAVEDQFSPESFVNHYGSTEIYTHATCDWVAEKPSCAGRAGINTQLRVVEPHERGEGDTEAIAETGDLGEIIVDASSLEAFDGYLGDDRDDRALVDDWFFTGDIGYKDQDGDLFVVGRVDNMIISGGENIYPVEVESVLETHDEVAETAVVGRPSERWNQTVVAFVTVASEPTETDFETLARDLDEYCRRSRDIADFKRPRRYVFTDHLVKSNVGKILRNELRREDVDVHVYDEMDI